MSVTGYEYYTLLPSSNHEPGDIWQNIPVKGLGRIKTAHAIVVTPSCDLAQGKSEVINFVPVIPISDYLLSRAFYFEAWQSVRGIFDTMGGLKLDSRFSLPSVEDIEAMIGLLDSKKDSTKLSQCVAFAEYARYAKGVSDNKPSVKEFIGLAKYNKLLENILRNSKSDIHFLPASRINDEYGLGKHSVAMFRYIFSVDITILDQAQSTSPSEWQSIHREKCQSQADYIEFSEYPVKVCTLKDDFLSDFLARHLNMHMRFGSRDFSAESIANMREQI